MKKRLFLFLILLSALAVLLYKIESKSSELEIEARNVEYRGDYDETKKLATFHGEDINVPMPKQDTEISANVLGSKKGDSKRIEIDLTNQRLYAYEDNKKVYDFLVSTGKWGRTPTGEFRIWVKLRYVLMSGGSKELNTYYYLPNVPFTMFFYNDEIPKYLGYGIHGTYWHSNFGHPMSHGCINMKTEEAEKLFYWANPSLQEGASSVYADDGNTGTRVIIYGEAPNS